jgi:hypothetical protein
VVGLLLLLLLMAIVFALGLLLCWIAGARFKGISSLTSGF